MKDSLAKANSKIAISLNLVGVAGTFPSIALIGGNYQSAGVGHSYIGISVLAMFWLFIIGTQLGVAAFIFDMLFPAALGITLWLFGVSQIGIIFGSVVVPDRLHFWFVTFPLVILSQILYVFFLVFYKRKVKLISS